jgi:signal transduction histidine kinase
MARGNGRWRSLSAGRLTAASIAAVLAVNAAGIWGIATARRDVRDEAARLFRSQTETRARSIESGLSATRTDLAFLAGSSAISRLGEGWAAGATAASDWARLAVQGYLLVFLRAHPEVKHVTVLAGKDEALVEVGSRGGVPVLWRAQDGAAYPPSVSERETPEIRAVFVNDTGAAVPRLVAELDVRALLDRGGDPSQGLLCQVRDATGRSLTRAVRDPEPGRSAEGGSPLVADSSFRAEGWSAPSPWALSCRLREGVGASLEPVAARGRLALVLNLVVMTLAALLGFVAVQQGRRRERLEIQAKEEERIRDLERQLFHAERLGTLGRWAAGLAHELNNPLEGMANYLSVARTHLGEGDLGAARGSLDLVSEGLGRAAGIVRQVLSQASGAGTPPEPVELGRVLRETLEFVRSRPEYRGLDFRVDVPDDALVVCGRPVMLGQVFLNLLRNACEAQPQGGEVWVRASRLGGDVRVEIADRGPGVPEGDRRRVFEPFYSTKSSTGLGLSVCEAIARQHQGRIELYPRENGGTVFAVTLPAGAPAGGP